MHEPAMPKLRRTAGAEGVEAPRLQARERFSLPVRAVRKALLHFFVVRIDAKRLAEVPVPVRVVDAAQKDVTPVRPDKPPATVVVLVCAVESVALF